MATAAQILANQANAQLSTGARTPEGQAASSQNRRTHGFTGRFTVLLSESQEEYDALLAELRAQENPIGIVEEVYVNQMAQSIWLQQRALYLQAKLNESATPNKDNLGQFALYLRYQTTAERNFDRCVNQLLKLRKEKRNAEIGFESQKRKEEAALAQAAKAAEAEEIAALERMCHEQMNAPLPDGTLPKVPMLRLPSPKEIAKMLRNAERDSASS